MEIIFAAGKFKIAQEGRRFGVYLANRELDWCARYEDASKLVQDLTVSASVHPDDLLIGCRKFCPADAGNGQIVVVVARSQNGYIVQPVGTTRRFEVSPDVLSDPGQW